MPVMDGIELAKRIRPGHDHSPKMVFVSGYTGGLNAQECRDLGIDTILSKPVDRHAIVDAVRQTLA
jgi:CheY-like chemotaxis protein